MGENDIERKYILGAQKKTSEEVFLRQLRC